jgi:hypothetical protein
MTSDDQDRFNPMTGEPINRPSDATAATHHMAAGDIAAPGQVHADYDRQRTALEPRDHILDLPQARAMTTAQRIAAKARARDATLITVTLPDLGETVKAVPKSFNRVLADITLTGIVTPAAQRSFYEAARTLEAMSPDEQTKLGEDTEEVLKSLGVGGSQDLFHALTRTYPLACLVAPRCVPTAADITDKETEIALEWLSPDDRMAIVNACMAEQTARAVAVAPFPDPSAPV